jgi:hypothetical protein
MSQPQHLRNSTRQFAGAVMLAVVLAGVVCVATSGFARGQNLQTHQSIGRTKAIGFSQRPAARFQKLPPKPRRCPQLCRRGAIRHSARLLIQSVDGYSVDALHNAAKLR